MYPVSKAKILIRFFITPMFGKQTKPTMQYPQRIFHFTETVREMRPKREHVLSLDMYTAYCIGVTRGLMRSNEIRRLE